MTQQITRKAGYKKVFPRALILGLALGMLLFPVIGLRSSLVLDASNVAGTEAQIIAPSAAANGVSDPTMVCTDGLISYWKLDEDDNPPAYVDSYDGHDGVCGAACPRSQSGANSIIGQAQKFNGINREINVDAHTDFDFGATDDWTVEFWIKRLKANALPGRNEIAIGRDYSPAPETARHWWVGMSVAGNAAFYMKDVDGSAGVWIEGPSLIAGPEEPDQWHHIVAVRDGSTGQNTLYVDGETRANMSKPAAFTSGFGSTKDLNIGWIDYASPEEERFHTLAILDEVAIYGRALTQQESFAFARRVAGARLLQHTPDRCGKVGQPRVDQFRNPDHVHLPGQQPRRRLAYGCLCHRRQVQ